LLGARLEPVGLIVTQPGLALRDGVLGDVAPTVLEFNRPRSAGHRQPTAMTGRSLIQAVTTSA
jgi:bisphosphoglycerate-independent phosphoglycerate mutase (AlkP superfamily)